MRQLASVRFSSPARVRLAVACAAWLAAAPLARAQAPDAAAARPLYAVEITTGPRWQASLPPQEQAYFREHSAHLRKLREHGTLVVGARYGDKGLLVLAAESEAAARALVEQDPSIGHGTFAYALYPFAVFYGGSVQPAPRAK